MKRPDRSIGAMLAIALLVLMPLLLAIGPREAGAEDDHPMLSRYPGSRIAWQDIQNFSPYRIATGEVTGYRKIEDWLDAKGRLTRTYYVVDGERTHSEVYENYRKALAEAGFAIVADGHFRDSSRAPGIGSRNWLNVYFAENPLPSSEGIELLAGSSTSGGSAFLAGTIDRAAGRAYVAITIAQQRADRVTYLVDVVEVDEVETDLVRIDAEAIGRDIAEYGRVTLHGLVFDHDKATLKAESAPVLKEIATFLGQHPDMGFYVVGHTDAVGSLGYNLDLSRARARAVLDALVREHGIAQERLDSHGVGPLSPMFANTGDSGRAKNRRVELVQR